MTLTFSFNRASRVRTGAAAPVLRGGRGFTLLEILMVMTLIALATLVVVPNIGELDARNFDVQARQAVALLNHARRTAVVNGTPASVTFYDAAEESADLPAPARNSVGSWYGDGIALGYQDSNDREVEIERQVEFSFYPEGGSSGGTLTLSANSRRIAIEVDPFTGRIRPEADDE